MITFLYGACGSGKTTEVMERIRKDTENGIHTFLIVPDQEAVSAERLTLHTLPPASQLILEVLSFSRLYNRVCREYGGLSYRYMTRPIRSLLMWKNLRELAPMLEAYGTLAESDPSLSDLMLSGIGECKSCGITPDMLEHTSAKLESGSPLAARLRDLALIYASFDRLTAEQYSDSADDLSRLYRVLSEHDFFAGTHVYIDSFTSFTAMEQKVIGRIFAQAEDTTVTIPLSAPDSEALDGESVRRSLDVLRHAALLCGKPCEQTLGKNRRATTPALVRLSEELWNPDTGAKERLPDDGSVTAEVCATPYAEAEAAAGHVLELLRSGARCRDIVILMRDVNRYRGIIEPALEKNGIPYFLAGNADLCAMPAVKLILSALRIRQYNWRKNDVITYLKTGLCRIELRSADLFEDYIDTWKLQGNRFLGDDWSMNPDGYTELLTPRGEEILRVANEVRRALTAPLEELFIHLDAAQNVPELCLALYAFLEALGLEESLSELAAREAAAGNLREAAQTRSVYGVILNTLADVATALPDEEADVGEFSAILRMVFSKTEIGTIPTSVDEVTIGSAATLRARNVKYALVLGLCEGEFPASIQDTGLFSSGDRKLLDDLQITLSSDSDTRSSDELMYVRRAFATPSHRLYLFTSRFEVSGKAKIPSLPFERVKKLLPQLKIHSYVGGELSYLAGAPKSAVSHLRAMNGTPQGEALRAALKPYLPNAETRTRAAVSDPHASLSPESAEKLMSRGLHVSYSRFEKYVNCPFSYYCTYVLKLRESGGAQVRSLDIGLFVHFLLENLLKFAVTEKPDGTFPEDDELIAMTAEKTEEYLMRICPGKEYRSAKLLHLYERLKRLSLLMVQNIVEEFRDSDFRPVFFELRTDGAGANPAPLIFRSTGGDADISFSGVIDRVDLLKKNGKLYIRVVDYKTGAKNFSLDDVRHGINMQMLLYLFTLCRNRNPEFLKAIGADAENPPHPAGVVYLSARIPVIDAESYTDKEEILRQAQQKLDRSGLLSDDEELLRAMSHSLSSDFLAGIKCDKDGNLKGSALTKECDFDRIFEDMSRTILNISREMQSGKADAEPLKYGDNDPCRYCNARPLCRKNLQ